MTTQKNPVIIGMTRFSVINKASMKSWRLGREAKENQEIFDSLFNKDRISTRLNIFIKHSLPTLKLFNKQNPNYVHIVGYSEEMPEEFKAPFLQSLSQYEFIIPVNNDPHQLELTTIPQILELTQNYSIEHGETSFPIGVFRLDDDDILSDSWMKNARPYVHTKFKNMWYSPSVMIYGLYDFHLQKYIKFRKVHNRMLAIGMMRIGVYNTFKNQITIPDNIAHKTADLKFPVICDGTYPAGIYTQHQHNDSNFNKPNILKEIEKTMQMGTDIDFDIEHEFNSANLRA